MNQTKQPAPLTGKKLDEIIAYTSPSGKPGVDLSPENIQKYLQFLFFVKSSLDLNPRFAITQAAKKFRVSGYVGIAMTKTGIIRRKMNEVRGFYIWNREGFEPNTQMSRELILKIQEIRKEAVRERKEKKMKEAAMLEEAEEKKRQEEEQELFRLRAQEKLRKQGNPAVNVSKVDTTTANEIEVNSEQVSPLTDKLSNSELELELRLCKQQVTYLVQRLAKAEAKLAVIRQM